ncbi:MAG: hypothetical protein ABL983_02260 [Nitrospira sp.]
MTVRYRKERRPAGPGRSTTVGIRPKPVDHRIEKRPFNVYVLR